VSPRAGLEARNKKKFLFLLGVEPRLSNPDINLLRYYGEGPGYKLLDPHETLSGNSSQVYWILRRHFLGIRLKFIGFSGDTFWKFVSSLLDSHEIFYGNSSQIYYNKPVPRSYSKILAHVCSGVLIHFPEESNLNINRYENLI
jgi:hypothetical protein